MKPFRMGLSLLALAAALLLIQSRPAGAAGPIVCSDWMQVNDGAFNLGTGSDSSYSSEEGFEVLTFGDRLYVGMEADNLYGARLWRTTPGGVSPVSQADWEEVIADASGCPFGDCTRQSGALQNDHIDSLAAFNGYLYASTANGGASTQGTQVWRSPSGEAGTWTQVNTDGFGSVQNTNFKDMQVFDGWLCGGTQNGVTGAQVWCTADGTSWVQKNYGGFGAGGDDNTTIEVWSGHVFGDALYFGAQSSGNVAKLFRTTDLGGTPAWAEVYSGPAGSRRADILGDLGGYLYISHSSSGGIVILRSPSGDVGTWTQVNTAGMDGDTDNYSAVVDSGVAHNGALYVGVTNTTTGVEVWRTAGVRRDGGLVDWTLVDGSGLGDPQNGYTELIPFRGELYAWTSNYVTGQQVRRATCPVARNVILLIGDGMGAKHQEAAQDYYDVAPPFQAWTQSWLSTFPDGGGYDPAQAWNNFDYVRNGYTDSAAAATALSAGVKTYNAAISVDATGNRLLTLSEKARALGRAAGAVTTVPVSHATPGAWIAHNTSRVNYLAIGDEGFWGDPDATGTHVGGRGLSAPPMDVLIGGGHPGWSSGYVSAAQRTKLADENGVAGALTFVERIESSTDGGARLLAAANTGGVTRLAGLFGGADGNIEYRLADGASHNPENPTLAEMTTAALAVLSRDPNGFVLLIEGGAVDWGAHNNRMDQVLGEVAGFNAAVQTVVDWVYANDPAWSNTLVIVTSDHETGYLTAGPDMFPDQALGMVDATTVNLEKPTKISDVVTGLRASWDDANSNNEIDAGETVYWAWNTTGHTNSLVPVYARGAGAAFLPGYATNWDTARGAYGDNTDVFRLMDAVTLHYPPPAVAVPPRSPVAGIGRLGAHDIELTWAAIAGSTGYEVWRSTAPYLNPGDPGANETDVAQSATSYVHDGAIGNATPNYFYAVRATSAGGPSAISGRVGVFSFTLQPGQ